MLERASDAGMRLVASGANLGPGSERVCVWASEGERRIASSVTA
jgi:hypothetical protein